MLRMLLNACVSLCRHLPKLPRLLESDDVNMRIAAGETIALLFELARDLDSVSSLSFLMGLKDCRLVFVVAPHVLIAFSTALYPCFFFIAHECSISFFGPAGV